MKKLFALILAMIMVLGLATTAYAAGETDLTVDTHSTTRTFDAYMLMTATHDGTTNYSYKVVPAYRPALLEGLKAVDYTTTESDDDVVDAWIIDSVSKLTSEQMRHFADAVYRKILADSISADVTGWDGAKKAVAQGYWLIADVSVLTGNDSNSVVMVDTVGISDVTVTIKPDTTSSEKKVDDENDSVAADLAGNEDGKSWVDVSDYDIGDEVPFRISGTLANNVTSYNYYAFKLEDTASAGLTHNADSIKLYINNVEQTIAAAPSTTAMWVYSIDGQVLTVYPNFGYTKNDGTKVETANATDGGDFLALFPAGTDHAAINSSTYRLEYTCTLNANATLENSNTAVLYVSNNPYGDGMSQTPKDTTVTFTYTFVVDKVDPEGNPLAGAEFTLYKFEADGSGTYTGSEPVAATAEEAAKNGTIFNHLGANCYGKFVKVDRLTMNTEGTKFTFKGIDDGFYLMLETKVPAGYHAIEPVEFHVVANHVTDLTGNPTKLIELKAVFKNNSFPTISGNTTTGTITAAIENQSGTELPHTGGMGTTLFYVFGGLMVAAALVLLVTKKRMSVN